MTHSYTEEQLVEQLAVRLLEVSVAKKILIKSNAHNMRKVLIFKEFLFK